MSNIKLSIFIQQWFFNIFLQNVGFLYSVIVLLLFFQYRIQLVNLIYDSYSLTSIGKFSRFDYPNIFKFCCLFFHLTLDLFKLTNKLFIGRIGNSFFNVKSIWNYLKHVFILQIIKLFQIIVKSFLVSNKKIVL